MYVGAMEWGGDPSGVPVSSRDHGAGDECRARAHAKGDALNADPASPSSRRWRTAVAALSLAMALAIAACAGSTPTPIYIVVTPVPTPTAVATPTPEQTPTPTPTPEATAGPSQTASPTPTPAPSATPTSAAARCSGGAANQPFWVDTANKEPFPVYCGVIPSGWGFVGAGSSFKPGYLVTATYKARSGTAQVQVQEGKVTSSFCAVPAIALGAASFGPMSGTLGGTSTDLILCINSGGYWYEALGTGGITQATFKNIVAAMTLVPRS
jgi:hypothetical protein